ncbi:elongation factor 1, putative, partial [Bodo saltans]
SLQWIFHFNHANGEALAKKFKNAFRLYNTVMQQQKTVEVLKAFGTSFGAYKKPEEPKKKEEAKPKEAKKPEPKDDDEEDDVVVEFFFGLGDLRDRGRGKHYLRKFALMSLWLWARQRRGTKKRLKLRRPMSRMTTFMFMLLLFKMQFMTANLIRGWFQRMEHTRKYAFGIALIIGEDKVHDIVGLWIFRGKGLPEIVTDVEDTELFTWEEIPDVNAQKEQITDYLCWEGPTIPKPVLEGRCFK